MTLLKQKFKLYIGMNSCKENYRKEGGKEEA
jgi:hypothetical protein